MSEDTAPNIPPPNEKTGLDIRRIILVIVTFLTGTIWFGIFFEKAGKDVPDWALVLLGFIILGLGFYWVWEAEIVKKHHHLIYTYPMLLSLAIMIAVGACVGGGFGALFWWSVYKQRPPAPTHTATMMPTPPIHPPFKEAHERYKTDLGNPLQKEELIGRVIHAEHEYGTTLLIHDHKVYLLYDDDNKLAAKEDKTVSAEDDYWLEDKEVIKRFRKKGLGTPPPDSYPPYGPIAKGWYIEPEGYKKIGWRMAHCRYDEAVYKQEFRDGMIVGVVRHLPSRSKDQTGRIYILLKKEGKWARWESVSPHDKAAMPPCLEPLTSWPKEGG
jgi:hypothetical protein